MEDIQQLIQMFANTKNKKFYDDIIERIKNQEKIWIAFSPSTKNYYIDYVKGSPSVFVFSKKEYGDLFKDYLLQRYVNIDIVEDARESRTRTFGDFYRSGFENVVVDNGQTFISIRLFDIIEKPDFSGMSEIERPVMNPSLVCAADRFFQNLAAKKTTRDMEYHMISEIYRGKYILPVDIDSKKTDKDSEKTIIKKDSTISVPFVMRQDGKKFIPLFTDWNEVVKYNKEKKCSGLITEFEDIENFCKKGDMVAINPFGFNMAIDSNTVNVIKSVMRNSKKNDEGETVTTFALDVYPEKIIWCLDQYLGGQSCVNAAYMRGIRRGDEVGYLIIVDFEGDKKSLFGDIAKAVEPYADGMPVDFISYSDEFAKSAVGGTKPFYQKIKIDI